MKKKSANQKNAEMNLDAKAAREFTAKVQSGKTSQAAALAVSALIYPH